MMYWQSLSYIVVVLFIDISSSSTSTLDDVCKTVVANNKDISYDYCIKFFQANNASATTDKRRLGDIATKMSCATALDNSKHIDALMASEKDKKIRGLLSDCRTLYSAAVNMLASAANLNAVISGIGTCEEGFRVLGVTSPLAAEDAEFIKDCSIALIITSSLL